MNSTYSPPSRRVLFLSTLLLFALIIGIFVFTENSMPSFSISSTRLADHFTSTASWSCDERLDELDRIFDQRRNARIELIDINKETPSYDLYEPEAVCFSDERFGSEKRYTAFGDGMFCRGTCLHYYFVICLPNARMYLSALVIVIISKVQSSFAVSMSLRRNHTAVKAALYILLEAITILVSKWVSRILWDARRTRLTQP